MPAAVVRVQGMVRISMTVDGGPGYRVEIGATPVCPKQGMRSLSRSKFNGVFGPWYLPNTDFQDHGAMPSDTLAISK